MKYLNIIIPVVVLFAVAMWMGGIYNGFVNTSENVDGQWAEVEAQVEAGEVIR
mgnify:CR=1 FL=1|jgi:hypothetical protein